MRLEFFTISVHGADDEQQRLNTLLNSVRVLSIDREFVADGPGSFWSICVQYQEPSQRGAPAGKAPAIDYKDVLSPEDFVVFARLRELRKRIATEEAVPPYSVFTNEQLSQMVQRQASSKSALKDINGIGDARIDKYGEAFLKALSETRPPLNGAS